MSDGGVLKGGVTLAAIGAICAGLVAATYVGTSDRIAANEKSWLERSLEPALSGLSYDGGITDARILIPPPHELPGSGPAIVYRVYAGGQPVAALFVVTARDGYAGPIRLLVGIDVIGQITGIQVLEHRETPGLGDRVDSLKSDWVTQFEGRSLADPEAAQWAIKRDGGQFDQLTGASVTPRAIVRAIRDTLLYFDANREQVFAAASAQAGIQEEP